MEQKRYGYPNIANSNVIRLSTLIFSSCVNTPLLVIELSLEYSFTMGQAFDYSDVDDTCDRFRRNDPSPQHRRHVVEFRRDTLLRLRKVRYLIHATLPEQSQTDSSVTFTNDRSFVRDQHIRISIRQFN
jgi:hypothetical protein